MPQAVESPPTVMEVCLTGVVSTGQASAPLD